MICALMLTIFGFMDTVIVKPDIGKEYVGMKFTTNITKHIWFKARVGSETENNFSNLVSNKIRWWFELDI